MGEVRRSAMLKNKDFKINSFDEEEDQLHIRVSDF